MDIKKIYDQPLESEVEFYGWIRFKRQIKKIIFLEIFDGTKLSGIQAIIKLEKITNEKFELLEKAPLFTAIHMKGILVAGKNEKEVFVTSVEEISLSNENIPLQKKIHSMEFLREIAHLRTRTKTFQSIFKIRSIIMFGIHEFFQKHNFVYVNSPILTSNDAEGAGETFKVFDQNKKNFFSNEGDISLSVSGQLHAEAFAQAFQKVYTLAPTFRAEKSNTQKHASEFWMMEPEIAFANYFEVMDLSADLLQYLAIKLKEDAFEEIDFLSKVNEVDVWERIKTLLNKKIKKISYEEAIKILDQNKNQFEEKNIYFGLDLATEHEKFIASFFGDSIVFIYDYPKQIKAFYMKLNDDNKTVRGYDLIVPEIGELIGGSERENDYNKLIKRVDELNIDAKSLEWYLELRKYGYLKSTGFGLGIERLVMYLTGTKNIRDVLPFPRTPGMIKF